MPSTAPVSPVVPLDHVEGIVVGLLAQMVDQQDGDAVFVRQGFQHIDFAVVVGVGIRFSRGIAHALEGINGNEVRLGML